MAVLIVLSIASPAPLSWRKRNRPKLANKFAFNGYFTGPSLLSATNGFSLVPRARRQKQRCAADLQILWVAKLVFGSARPTVLDASIAALRVVSPNMTFGHLSNLSVFTG